MSHSPTCRLATVEAQKDLAFRPLPAKRLTRSGGLATGTVNPGVICVRLVTMMETASRRCYIGIWQMVRSYW